MSSHAKCYLAGTRKISTSKIPTFVKANAAKEDTNVEKIRKDVEKLTVHSAQCFMEIASDRAASKEYMEKLSAIVHDLKVDCVSLKKAKLNEVVHEENIDSAPPKIVINETLQGKILLNKDIKSPHLNT